MPHFWPVSAREWKFRRLWRYRIGDYRLICDIRDEVIAVVVLEVGHRKDVSR